ncbi:MAG: hypothetical protein ACTHN8_11050 [Angustibacter sp.]
MREKPSFGAAVSVEVVLGLLTGGSIVGYWRFGPSVHLSGWVWFIVVVAVAAFGALVSFAIAVGPHINRRYGQGRARSVEAYPG